MSREELLALLSRFAGLPPPHGHDQDDWDDWLVESVLIRCRRDHPDEARATAAAIALLSPLKFFRQLQPHLERRLGRPLVAGDFAQVAPRRPAKG